MEFSRIWTNFQCLIFDLKLKKNLQMTPEFTNSFLYERRLKNSLHFFQTFFFGISYSNIYFFNKRKKKIQKHLNKQFRFFHNEKAASYLYTTFNFIFFVKTASQQIIWWWYLHNAIDSTLNRIAVWFIFKNWKINFIFLLTYFRNSDWHESLFL